jgi:hypothetical protein
MHRASWSVSLSTPSFSNWPLHLPRCACQLQSQGRLFGRRRRLREDPATKTAWPHATLPAPLSYNSSPAHQASRARFVCRSGPKGMTDPLPEPAGWVALRLLYSNLLHNLLACELEDHVAAANRGCLERLSNHGVDGLHRRTPTSSMWRKSHTMTCTLASTLEHARFHPCY